MPPKSQKKQCSKPNCTGVDCPFPHPPPPKFHDAPLAPKTRYHGAEQFRKRNMKTICGFFALENVEKCTDSREHPSEHKTPTSVMVRRCPRCRQTFELPVETQKWFYEKKMHLPKRCAECRLMKRLEGCSTVVSPKTVVF